MKQLLFVMLTAFGAILFILFQAHAELKKIELLSKQREKAIEECLHYSNDDYVFCRFAKVLIQGAKDAQVNKE